MLKEIFGDHVDGWVYNTLSIFQSAWAKITGTVISFFGLQLIGFYGDLVLLNLLFKLMILDLAIGVWDACKNRRWEPRIFLVRGMIKFPMYALYIFLVATLDHTAERILDKSVPIVELFCLYLLSGEVYSISKHLKYLGFKVPEPLLWLSFGFKKKAENKIKDLSGVKDEDLPKEQQESKCD